MQQLDVLRPCKTKQIAACKIVATMEIDLLDLDISQSLHGFFELIRELTESDGMGKHEMIGAVEDWCCDIVNPPTDAQQSRGSFGTGVTAIPSRACSSTNEKVARLCRRYVVDLL